MSKHCFLIDCEDTVLKIKKHIESKKNLYNNVFNINIKEFCSKELSKKILFRLIINCFLNNNEDLIKYFEERKLIVSEKYYKELISKDLEAEILDTLNKYNFDLQEKDEVTDEQITPNILSVIFENSLDNQNKKSKGIVYTPKIITDYMCRESIIYHLCEKLCNVSTDDIRNFVDIESNVIPKTILSILDEVDSVLKTIKTCDIACGCGAFNISMLDEITRLRYLLVDPKHKTNEVLFKIKKQTLENNIYGVDIESEAVKIAEIRLLLSVISVNTNINIKELPKIHNNFEVKNSLIDNITFILKDGFDIITGNPPYVGEKGNKHIFQPITQTEFGKKYYQGKMDLLYFFFHKGIDLLKENGILSFITTNYFITANGAKKLRSDFKTRTSVLKMINFGEIKIFENALGQHNIITFLRKESFKSTDALMIVNNSKSKGVCADSKILQQILSNKSDYIDSYLVHQDDIYDGEGNYIRFFNQNTSNNILEFSILSKIQLNSVYLGGKNGICSINTGIQSGVDKISKKHCSNFKDRNFIEGSGVFVLNKDNPIDNKVLQSFSKEEFNFLKPFYKNSDIEQYFTKDFSSKLIIYAQKNNFDFSKNTNLKKHIYNYISIINNSSSNSPFLHRPRIEQIFKGEKIVAPQRSKLNTFGYSNEEWYAASDVFFITNPSNDFKIKYILALLNSKLYYFWLYNKGKRKGTILELIQTPLSEIPIKQLSLEKQSKYEKLINSILEKKSDIQKVNELSIQIDELIYKDFNLSKEEIDFVEKFYYERIQN